MGYRRLFIMRKDLHMSAGKLSAQIGHCAEAYWLHLIRSNIIPTTVGYSSTLILDRKVYDQYINGAIVKTVCEAKSKNHLLKAKSIAEDCGLVEGRDFGLIYDKCYTELEPEEEDGTVLTGIWFMPLDDGTAHLISKKYQLYK